MRTRILVSMTAFLALLLAAGLATAQDQPNWAAAPTYGTQNLSAGFMPDPVEVSLLAGGPNQVSIPGCVGYINNAAPDVDLNYTAGGFQLSIYVKSDADTTLVINQPDGTYVCNDDTSGFNPAVILESPQSGNYNIWVGNYDGTATPAATVYISEMPPQW